MNAPPVPEEQRMRPYSKNPHYWQYKGEPVLLIGGSVEDCWLSAQIGQKVNGDFELIANSVPR
jgi:hypothetical protein